MERRRWQNDNLAIRYDKLVVNSRDFTYTVLDMGAIGANKMIEMTAIILGFIILIGTIIGIVLTYYGIKAIINVGDVK